MCIRDRWCTEDLPEPSPGGTTWERHLDELRELVGEGPVEHLQKLLTEQQQAERETAVELGERSELS